MSAIVVKSNVRWATPVNSDHRAMLEDVATQLSCSLFLAFDHDSLFYFILFLSIPLCFHGDDEPRFCHLDTVPHFSNVN